MIGVNCWWILQLLLLWPLRIAFTSSMHDGALLIALLTFFSTVRDIAVFHVLLTSSSWIELCASLDHSDLFQNCSVFLSSFLIKLRGFSPTHSLIFQIFLSVPLKARRLSASRVSGFSFSVLVRLESFFTNHPKKPTVTSLLLDSAPPMTKPSVKPTKPSAKQKRGRPIGLTKQAKKWDIGQEGFSFPVLIRLEGFFTNSVSFGRDAYSASFSNSVNFGRDAHLASSSNSASFPSMSSTLPWCSLSMSSTSPQCSLSMSNTSLPVVWFSSSVFHWVRMFFIRFILRFSSSVSHWVRRFFIHHALSKLYFYTPTRLAELAS